MIGVMLLSCARSLRGPQAAIIPYATLLVWTLLLLGLPLLHGDDIVRDGAELAAWIGALVALLLLSVFALTRSVPTARAEAQHL
jgi:hypothetical protein